MPHGILPVYTCDT